MARRRWTRWTPRLVLAVVPVVVLLGGLELWMRSHPPAGPGVRQGLDPDNPEAVCVEPSWSRGWRPVRDECERDSHGLLTASSGRLQDAPRLVVVGDSIAQQHTWVEAMASELASSWGGVQVWNAGSSGYDPCQAWRAWSEDAAQVEPELVLWQLVANDLLGSPVLAPLEDGRFRYHLGNGQAFDLPGWVLSSRLVTHVTLTLGASRAARQVQALPAERVATTKRCLGGLATELEAQGTPLVAVLFPVLADEAPPKSREANELDQERELAALLEELGIDTYRLRQDLSSVEPLRGMRYTPDDSLHPHVRVHPVIGELVAGELVSRHDTVVGGPKGR